MFDLTILKPGEIYTIANSDGKGVQIKIESACERTGRYAPPDSIVVFSEKVVPNFQPITARIERDCASGIVASEMGRTGLAPKCSICGACAHEVTMVKHDETADWICNRHPIYFEQAAGLHETQDDKPSLAEQGRAMLADADAAIAKSNAKPEEAYRETSRGE